MTLTDHTLAVRNVTVDALIPMKGGAQRFALSWELRDARYHIWFDKLADLDPDTKRLNAADFTLYKNPPRHIGRGDKGDYWTRQLDPAAKANLAPVEAARRIAIADNLYQRALTAKVAERQAAERETEEALRVATVRDAGPALLEALRDAKEEIQAWRNWADQKIGRGAGPEKPLVTTGVLRNIRICTL